MLQVRVCRTLLTLVRLGEMSSFFADRSTEAQVKFCGRRTSSAGSGGGCGALRGMSVRRGKKTPLERQSAFRCGLGLSGRRRRLVFSGLGLHYNLTDSALLSQFRLLRFTGFQTERSVLGENTPPPPPLKCSLSVRVRFVTKLQGRPNMRLFCMQIHGDAGPNVLRYRK